MVQMFGRGEKLRLLYVSSVKEEVLRKGEHVVLRRRRKKKKKKKKIY